MVNAACAMLMRTFNFYTISYSMNLAIAGKNIVRNCLNIYLAPPKILFSKTRNGTQPGRTPEMSR